MTTFELISLLIINFTFSLGFVQLMYWGICMCFRLNYVFLHGVGLWLILFALKIIFRKQEEKNGTTRW